MSPEEPTLAELFDDATGLFHVGRTEDAVQRLDDVLQRDDRHPGAWYYRGRCMQQAGDHRAALHCFQTAVELEPEYAAAHCEAGICLNDLGEYTEALSYFAEAVKLDPGMYAALINSGYSYERRGQFDEAAACYEKVLGRDPMNAAAWLNLGSTLLSAGRPRDALECFEDAYDLADSEEFRAEAHGIDPDFFKARAMLGVRQCHAMLGGR